MSGPDLLEREPTDLAEAIVSTHGADSGWLDEFVHALDRRRAGNELERVLRVWGLSQAQAGRLFGVSRQAVGKWLHQGVPAERVRTVGDLAAATDLLLRYLKRDRIPAVVRRDASALGDRNLLDLVANEGSGAALQACRRMFDFGRVQS